jgi:aryl-alcohol dehydrogenase-like predicted oxidoreductase
MRNLERSGTFQLGDLQVRRLGYGAMHLAGAGIFGPPKDRNAALAVLPEAVAAGVNHIDTSDYYGPHITNQLIREALHPYPDDLVVVTKIGARRGNDGSVLAGQHGQRSVPVLRRSEYAVAPTSAWHRSRAASPVGRRAGTYRTAQRCA